jgi:hypothetical protein
MRTASEGAAKSSSIKNIKGMPRKYNLTDPNKK